MTPSGRTPWAPLLLLLTAAALGTAGAQEPARYRLEGSDPTRGPFTSEVLLRRDAAGLLRLERTARYADGGEDQAAGQVLEQAGGRSRARLQSQTGLRGAVAGEGAPEREFVLEVDAASGACRTREQTPAGEALAVGQRVEGQREPRPSSLTGQLLLLGKQELRRALERGVDLGAEFGLGDYLHVGVAAEVRVPREVDLTPEQRAGLRPGLAWVETRAEGGARLPMGTTIPLTDSLSLQFGIEPAARLRYRIAELVPVVDGPFDLRGLRDAGLEVARREIRLPLDAASARALAQGEEAALEGEMSVAISGSLVLGEDLAEVGELARVGASARLGGFYRVRQEARLRVVRLAGDRVRVQLTRVQGRGRGLGLELLVGVQVESDRLGEAGAERLGPSLEYLEPVVDLAAREASRTARSVLRFQLELNAGEEEEEQFEVCYAFDLSDPAACAAYERAVRGDLTAAAREVAGGGCGVEEERRLLGFETRTRRAGQVNVLELFKTGGSRALSVRELIVDRPAGRSHVDVNRLEREGRTSWLVGLSRSERRMTLELLRERSEAGETQGRRALRLRWEHRDPGTSKGDFDRLRRLCAAWGLAGAGEDELPAPRARFLQPRFGVTRTWIEVRLAEPALAALAAVAPVEAIVAWGKAIHHQEERVPLLIYPQGRRALERYRRERPTGLEERVEHQLRWGLVELNDAEAFARAVTALGQATSPAELTTAVEELGSAAELDLTALAALLELVPAEAVHVRVDVEGERVRYRGERVGAGFAPLLPDLEPPR